MNNIRLALKLAMGQGNLTENQLDNGCFGCLEFDVITRELAMLLSTFLFLVFALNCNQSRCTHHFVCHLA